jgi:hypothetical protein
MDGKKSMTKKHKVKRGECISSIAEMYGLVPNLIWNDPANEALKELRKNPSILEEGDIVVIPARKTRQVEVEVGKKHRFRRKGASEKIRLQLSYFGEPRANLKYKFEVDGDISEGVTDKEGWLEEYVPPSAMMCKIIIEGEDKEDEEEYELMLGRISPIDTDAGVEERLMNLGFFSNYLDEEGRNYDPEKSKEEIFILALNSFQQQYELPITETADEATREKLLEIYGC